jgi:hypothetical protein
MTAETVLAAPVTSADTPLTEHFLVTSLRGVKHGPDAILFTLPTAESLVSDSDHTISFGLQLCRLCYADDAQSLGVNGAAFWAPALQVAGLPGGPHVCPVLSLVLGTARQLELLLAGLGCTIMTPGEADAVAAIQTSPADVNATK